LLDPIALAVPFFFVLIGIEMLWAKRRGVRVYRFADAITDLSCGITSQIVLLVWATTQLAIYAAVYARLRVVTFEHAWVPWVIAFFAVDFFYYWWHRLSHEVNFLWAAHVVHHPSEDYNLAVALRQAVLTSWTALPFYLPLAVLGVPTHVFALVHALSTLYQFWIHTRLVGKIRGPIDWVLNLPSHHRVHHAVNAPYLDKNYGATLIVWDRLFGTYAEEIEEPVYGITKPLGTFDPLWAQVHYWFEMASMARAAQRPGDKLRVLFASPAWKPDGWVPFDAGDPLSRPKYDRPLSRGLAAYIGVQYAIVVLATFAILMWHHGIARHVLVVASLAVLASLVAFGALVEGRRWARAFEGARLAVAAVAVFAVVTSGCRRRQEEPRLVPLEGESAVLPRRAPAAVPPMHAEPRNIVVDGGTRKWLLVEPATIDPAKRYALVLVFHGDGGNARGFHQGFPFERGSGDGAILAYLDGIRTTWDLETRKGENRDVKFAKAVIEQLLHERPIDKDRVFAAGYSSGGFFSNVLACHEPGLLRAISSSAGGAPYKQAETWPNGYPKCPGQTPTATIALHGERDFAVTLDSGRFSASYWAYVNGCNTGEWEPTGYGECRSYRGCNAGKPVVWCDIADLDHWVWERAAEASWTFFQSVAAAK
jgi:sterol desaturase/sphingolipid hydroxylase (fatty acid hydroxylase superfamily)/poly(3-hydroxybutyrate) depolymerase